MALDWQDYDGFDWAGAQQSPMSASERAGVETLAAHLMGVSRNDRLERWGIASSPGRFAATVIHILPNIRHRYLDQASAHRIPEVGVKIFKTNGDALREGKQVLPFHHEQVHKLPGLPNDHAQKTLGGGTHRDNLGVARYYCIQEWVPGDTLEELLRRKWSSAPADVDRVRSILEQLFLKIIIPLWSEGTIWWDIREANYCWDEALGKLQLIDIYSLTAYADEILKTPDVWERRDRGRKVALARLRQMTLRLLVAPRLGAKNKIQSKLAAVWNSDLEPALNALGRDHQRKIEFKENALCALQRALQHILTP